jgi:hypothetical protein
MCIAKEKSTPEASAVPVIGAAPLGCGAQASGIARARQVDLCPGVQVGEVLVGPRGPVERGDVRLQLDQVARDEARGQPQAPEHLHQQPGGVAAGAAARRERLLAGLDAGLHPDDVVHVRVQPAIELDQEVDGGDRAAIDRRDPAREQRTRLVELEIGLEFLGGARFVGEGILLGLGLEEEVEGIEDRHLGHEVDLQAELAGPLGNDDPGQVVAERVLLPVQEVFRRLDMERIAQDAGARVWRRPQADDLGPQRRGPVVAVAGLVRQCNVDGHRASSP